MKKTSSDQKLANNRSNLLPEIRREQPVLKEKSVPYSKLLFTFADRKEKCLIFFGYAFAILCGIGMPS
jgi:hypothetical protein